VNLPHATHDRLLRQSNDNANRRVSWPESSVRGERRSGGAA